jgi:hypothetical protein
LSLPLRDRAYFWLVANVAPVASAKSKSLDEFVVLMKYNSRTPSVLQMA